jgi:hypothetical protein
MKGRVLVLLVLGLCALFSLARADISTRNLLYTVWIEKEIERCRIRANLAYSKGENLRHYGERAAAQASFYRHSKHLLVREMVEESVGTKPYKVNYFLISTYKHHQSGLLLAVR